MTRLPSLSLTEAERRSALGRSLLRRIERLEPQDLPHSVLLDLRLVRFCGRFWEREADWYWLVVDPVGIGHFGEFLPAAYCGGFLLNVIHMGLKACTFREAGDADRYLGLVADYARLISQFSERTSGQAERGIRMPRAQVRNARALLAGFKAGVREALSVESERLSNLADIRARALTSELEHRISDQILPAFDRSLEVLSDAYLTRAPETVGLGQYPGGAEVYAELVRLHTTLDLTPLEVHQRGLSKLREIEAAMEEIREELGFSGSGEAFLTHVGRRPEWRASTVEGLTAVFQRYIDRFKPRFDEYFARGPRADYRVAALPEALQGSMTFGYFDAPRTDHAEGIYFFNPKNMLEQPLVHVAALTYHELMPGHHLQEGLAQENVELHPFRTYTFVTAYCEGWAEYAATLVAEMGLYETPEERYGRLMFDAFFTCRLVVDTGMNVLGWSLEQARDYMRAHSGRSEAEIRSETLRYSCDIPAQALAYKIGDAKILEIREHARATLGTDFSLKEFHTTVLDAGSLPLEDLAWHVETQMAVR